MSAPEPAAALPTVVFLGDSTLDNIVWVSHVPDAKDVKGHLEDALAGSGGGRVVNLAADGFTTADVLNGGRATISAAARAAAGDPFPHPRGTLFAPVTHLESVAKDAPGDVFTVLSVGGNDIRCAVCPRCPLVCVCTCAFTWRDARPDSALWAFRPCAPVLHTLCCSSSQGGCASAQRDPG